jgi:hypothetical protein
MLSYDKYSAQRNGKFHCLTHVLGSLIGDCWAKAGVLLAMRNHFRHRLRSGSHQGPAPSQTFKISATDTTYEMNNRLWTSKPYPVGIENQHGTACELGRPQVMRNDDGR